MTAAAVLVVTSALLVATGCAGGGPSASSGSRLFCVSKTGSDLNAGSCTAPWKTIQKALDTAKPGQTILVRPGIYREDLIARRSGTPTDRIVLRPYAGGKVIIHGRLRIEANNLRVVGFRIDGKGLTRPTPLVYVNGGRSVTLERVEIVNSIRSGLFVSNSARDVNVLACWAHANGTRAKLDHGIVFARGRAGTIQSTVVEHNKAGGILIYPGYDDVLVNQNTIVRNGAFGILVGGERTTSDEVVIANNIVAFNGGQGIRTFWGGDVGSGNIATYNLIWGNSEDDVSRAGMTQQGNFHAAPRFIDVAAGDLRLQRRSPAVGQALVRYTARIDRNGQPRPQGQRPDLGAFER